MTLTRVFFLGPFSDWSEKFKLIEEPRPTRKDPIYRFYSWIDTRAVSKVFSIIPRSASKRSAPNVSEPRKQTLRKREPKARQTKFIRIAAASIGVAILVLVIFEVFHVLLAAGISFTVLASKESLVLVGLGYSFVRVWYVYVISVAVGLPLGIVIATQSKLYQSGSTILQIISAIPSVAILPPIAVLAVNLPFSGELTAAIVIFLGTIWYIIFNVIAGIRSIPSEIFEVSKLMGLKGWAYWKNVLIPAALPSFVTGSITGVGAAWNTLIVAEYFSVNGTVISRVGNGVGVLINVAINKGDLVFLGLTVFSMSTLIVAVNLLFWRRMYRYTTKRFSYNR